MITEKAIAVQLILKGSDREIAREHLEELAFLALTAGAEVTETFKQELQKPNVKTYLGKGKVEEIKEYVKENTITLVIFDDDLSPVQTRNLEKELEVKVIDRSALILDIFARRARSTEAKTQVELAQMQYLMPRLTRMWTHLSKQFGGIGTKGPGETQIETDRRIIKTKIQQLKERLLDIDKQREIQSKHRSGMPRFALVGYTNAGKSTLMRVITTADVYIEDKLFATLDTTVRHFTMTSGQEALLSDTVGFIRKLPTHLIASFRSTLAEASSADVLIHVVDVSNPYFRDHIAVVEETLESLKITDKPTILVLNKLDLIDKSLGFRAIEKEFKDSIFISAERGINIRNLMEKMLEVYIVNSKLIEFVLPYDQMNLLSVLYKVADVIDSEEKDYGIEYKVKVHSDDTEFFKSRFEKFITRAEN
ncbi:MAG: GTPase HflX [Candidatus Kapabacteria bacterium]|nr:GTPase HflX [Candidatus Kapabacteria bacterium]